MQVIVYTILHTYYLVTWPALCGSCIISLKVILAISLPFFLRNKFGEVYGLSFKGVGVICVADSTQSSTFLKVINLN